MARLFRRQPPAVTSEDLARQLASVNMRNVLLSAPPGWVWGDILHALHYDAVEIVKQLDRKETSR